MVDGTWATSELPSMATRELKYGETLQLLNFPIYLVLIFKFKWPHVASGYHSDDGDGERKQRRGLQGIGSLWPLPGGQRNGPHVQEASMVGSGR